jgi:hypothetical protein
MMSNIARIVTVIAISLGLIGCAVYPAPVAYAPRPYYASPVVVYHGGWH